jgi:hypothetical protein
VENGGNFLEDLMRTHCERHGQMELGIVEQEGRTFSAFGATITGRHLTAYTKVQDGQLTLVSWCGKTMLACR